MSIPSRTRPLSKLENRHCRQGTPPSTVDFIRAGGNTPITTATPTANASQVIQTGSDPASILMPATPSTDESNGNDIGSSPLFRLYLEKSHRQTQLPVYPEAILRHRLPALYENNLKNLPPRPQKNFRYQQPSALN